MSRPFGSGQFAQSGRGEDVADVHHVATLCQRQEQQRQGRGHNRQPKRLMTTVSDAIYNKE
ncbi:MAG: hypothetical protein PUD23_07125 [Prevotella sp.]|nr:hypothetical protein [Prevotella sp.]